MRADLQLQAQAKRAYTRRQPFALSTCSTFRICAYASDGGLPARFLTVKEAHSPVCAANTLREPVGARRRNGLPAARLLGARGEPPLVALMPLSGPAARMGVVPVRFCTDLLEESVVAPMPMTAPCRHGYVGPLCTNSAARLDSWWQQSGERCLHQRPRAGQRVNKVQVPDGRQLRQ